MLATLWGSLAFCGWARAGEGRRHSSRRGLRGWFTGGSLVARVLGTWYLVRVLGARMNGNGSAVQQQLPMAGSIIGSNNGNLAGGGANDAQPLPAYGTHVQRGEDQATVNLAEARVVRIHGVGWPNFGPPHDSAGGIAMSPAQIVHVFGEAMRQMYSGQGRKGGAAAVSPGITNRQRTWMCRSCNCSDNWPDRELCRMCGIIVRNE